MESYKRAQEAADAAPEKKKKKKKKKTQNVGFMEKETGRAFGSPRWVPPLCFYQDRPAPSNPPLAPPPDTAEGRAQGDASSSPIPRAGASPIQQALGPVDRPRRRRDALDLVAVQLAGDAPLDLVEQLALVGQDEGEGDAVAAHPAGAADPVDVVLGVLGQVEVDDVRDARHVDAPADDVGGHQRSSAARAGSLEHPVALRLRQVAVHRLGLEPLGAEQVADLVGPALGPAEDDGPASAARAPGA